MRSIKFEIPNARQLEINGHVFDIKKADTDVLMKASELRNKYAELTGKENLKSDNFDEIVDAVKSVIHYIDEMLGEGATDKITGGVPLGIVNAVNLMTVICKAVVEEYNDTVADKYGD